MTASNRRVWKPIELWNIEWHRSYLPEVFDELKGLLTEEDWRSFRDRCAREWSIETGQIENAFELERGVTLEFIREGFVSSMIGHQRNGLSQEQVHAILMDTKEALDGLFDFIKSAEPLTTSYIKQLHQQLMKSVDHYDAYYIDLNSKERVLSRKTLNKGKYKTLPNSPLRDGVTEEYCPPEQTSGQMEDLVRIYNEYDPARTSPEVRAAWLHHAFTQIHPFEDGNGRVARALASLVLIKSGLPPLTVPRTMRTRYLRSLEAADNGRAQTLVEFFESCLYRQIVALWREIQIGASVRVSSTSTVEEIIKAAQTRLVAKHGLSPVAWNVAKTYIDTLRSESSRAILELAQRLGQSLSQVDSRYVAAAGSSEILASAFGVSILEHWNEEPQEDYTLEGPALLINSGSAAQITVVCDSLSKSRKGLVAFAVVLQQKEVKRLIEPCFFSNFKEPLPQQRFLFWLSGALRSALFEWQEAAGR